LILRKSRAPHLRHSSTRGTASSYIPALDAAQKRIRTEGLLKKKVNTNACLRTDAAEAILYLQSL
jgi:hypothetical protein